MAAEKPTREMAVANPLPSKVEMAQISYESACDNVNEAKDWRTVFYLEHCRERRGIAKQNLDEALRLEAVVLAQDE